MPLACGLPTAYRPDRRPASPWRLSGVYTVPSCQFRIVGISLLSVLQAD